MPGDVVFTYGPANIDSLLATTLSSIQKTLSDNIFSRYPLFYHLRDKNKITLSGGASIVMPLMYAVNSTAKPYNAYDTLDTTPQNGLTAAQYLWKQYSVSISIAGREERQNAGKEGIIKLLETKTKQAEMSLARQLDIDLWATTQATTRLNAVPVVVDDTGTVGDVSGAANTWWRSTDTASGSFAARGLSDLRALYNTILDTSQSDGVPDFLITTQAVLEFYEGALQPQQRLMDEKMGNAGFQTLRYKAAPITFGSNVPSGQLYMLRAENLWLVCHSAAQFATTQFVKPSNQDARVAQILLQAELVTDNRRKLGRLTGVTA